MEFLKSLLKGHRLEPFTICRRSKEDIEIRVSGRAYGSIHCHPCEPKIIIAKKGNRRYLDLIHDPDACKGEERILEVESFEPEVDADLLDTDEIFHPWDEFSATFLIPTREILRKQKDYKGWECDRDFIRLHPNAFKLLRSQDTISVCYISRSGSVRI
ncbi:hypothetical protein MMC07_003918 [Pseudocyphellaria aurata]|nr:hypothetical protein [Pseudocyphellaria aurata]